MTVLNAIGNSTSMDNRRNPFAEFRDLYSIQANFAERVKGEFKGMLAAATGPGSGGRR